MNLYKLSAFTLDPSGGNPAGVWVGDSLPNDSDMQKIAHEVGYSETAFIAPSSDDGFVVRYFSPEMEVPFCGHATIASGVQLGKLYGAGEYLLQTQAGIVPVMVNQANDEWTAALTSVATQQKEIDEETLSSFLDLLNWHKDDLGTSIAPSFAYAGAWHLILSVHDRQRLAHLEYDFAGLKDKMDEFELITLQLVFRESDSVFHSRNPFPVGGVIEDPATGAAAAALGGYLRDAGIVQTPAEITIHQGHDMGRPSLLQVSIPESGGIVVAGTAVELN